MLFELPPFMQIRGLKYNYSTVTMRLQDDTIRFYSSHPTLKDGLGVKSSISYG